MHFYLTLISPLLLTITEDPPSLVFQSKTYFILYNHSIMISPFVAIIPPIFDLKSHIQFCNTTQRYSEFAGRNTIDRIIFLLLLLSGISAPARTVSTSYSCRPKETIVVRTL